MLRMKSTLPVPQIQLGEGLTAAHPIHYYIPSLSPGTNADMVERFFLLNKFEAQSLQSPNTDNYIVFMS